MQPPISDEWTTEKCGALVFGFESPII